MSELSQSPRDKATKARSEFLHHLESNEKQTAIAAALGGSDSTITRTKEKIEDVFYLLYQAGWMCVPADMVCVDRRTYEAVTLIASKAMGDEDIAHKITQPVGGAA